MQNWQLRQKGPSQKKAGAVTRQKDTEAYTHRVMGSQIQGRVTQPKGCSLTLIVCRHESVPVFITPVVSGERTHSISGSCQHVVLFLSLHSRGRARCLSSPNFVHVFFFSTRQFLSHLPSVYQRFADLLCIPLNYNLL